nr:hypothetical protein [Tanacetum cinerariifolium]GFA83477.1 hypothetical protein [Tanacetum cinerariifolium]
MASLADKAILSGAENRPPMLEKDMYDSWRSRMEMYMLNRQHGRIILESVEHGPLIWPSVTEDGVTRLKKYSKLSAAEATQADCNIDYALIAHHPSEFSSPETGLVVSVFQKGDDPIDAINHMMSFLTSVVTSRIRRNIWKTKADDLDAYDSDCDELNSAKVALMANLSYYGSDNLAEEEELEFFADPGTADSSSNQTVVTNNVNNQDNKANYLTPQERQVQSTSKQSTILTQSNTEIASDSNIISYSQYMNESQYNTVQNLTLPTLQDDLILSEIEQLKTQVVTCIKINQDNKHVNELLTVELERYRRQEKVLNELKHDEKASTLYESSQEIESLKRTLSKHLKEKESLEQKITILKNDFQKE